MHGKQFSSPTEEPNPRRHFMQGAFPFLPKKPFLQVQCRLPGIVELDPAGQARQVDEVDDEGALLLLLSMGEKNPMGQPPFVADSTTNTVGLDQVQGIFTNKIYILTAFTDGECS